MKTLIFLSILLLCACTKEEAAHQQGVAQQTDTSDDLDLVRAPIPEGAKKCACGDYPTLYEYFVRQGTGCCTGELLTDKPAIKLSFVDGGYPGVWRLTKTEKIEPAEVQRVCCAKS